MTYKTIMIILLDACSMTSQAYMSRSLLLISWLRRERRVLDACNDAVWIAEWG